MSLDFLAYRGDLLGAYDTLRNQLFRIQLRKRFVHAPNILIHRRLRKRRLIDLVMSMLPKANHVNQNVFSECFPIFYHELADSEDSLGGRRRIRRIHPNNWNAKSFHDIRTIPCAPPIFL